MVEWCRRIVEKDKGGGKEIGDTNTRYKKCQVEESFLYQLRPVSIMISSLGEKQMTLSW